MATSTKTRPWQETIAAQLADHDPEGNTYAIIHLPDDGPPELLAQAANEEEAVIAAEDHSVKVNGGEVTVIAFAELGVPAGRPADGPQLKPDPDKGKLFNIPRTEVILDDADPSLLKIAFAGGIEIERNEPQWVEYYNRLAAGKSATITVTVHVAGSKKTHRRDKDGNVDAIVETKSLVITDVHLQDAAA